MVTDVSVEDIFERLDATTVESDLSDRVEHFRRTLIKRQFEQATGQPSDEHVAAQAMLRELEHSVGNLHTLSEPLALASYCDNLATQWKNFAAEYRELLSENTLQKIETIARRTQGWAEFTRGIHLLSQPTTLGWLKNWREGFNKIANAIDIYWEEVPESIRPKIEILAEKILKKLSKREQIKLSATSLKHTAGFILFRIQQEKQEEKGLGSYYTNLALSSSLMGRTSEEQAHLNQPAIDWIRAKIHHAQNMSEEEARLANEEWEAFKEIMNSQYLAYPEENNS